MRPGTLLPAAAPGHLVILPSSPCSEGKVPWLAREQTQPGLNAEGNLDAQQANVVAREWFPRQQ